MDIMENNGMYRVITICVDSYRNSVISGRVSIPFLQAEYTFRNTMDFLKKTNVMLEKMPFPTSFSECAVFRETSNVECTAKLTATEGKLATFRMSVVFRENASWQGSIVWVEGRQGESFRSTLEMLMLMDSALVGKSTPQTVATL